MLLYGVSSLADLDYVDWLLKMTLAALNLCIGQQLKHRPIVGKPEAPVSPSGQSSFVYFRCEH
jgi:hypothetical protein